ncbi:MAG: hypothetical protein K2Y33_08810 [Mycolicibacterium frederiksbergense]|nr:hypothetical protein [Mycolicibacterium frederiksbergense]
MPEYVYRYMQGNDIRWYASEPLHVHATRAAAAAAAATKKRVTLEDGRYIEWAETSTSFGVCYALATYWIIKRARGEDFLAWLQPGSRACPDIAGAVNPGAGQMVADIKSMQVSQHGKDSTIKIFDAITRIKQETGLVSRDSVPVKKGDIKAKEGFTVVVITGQRKVAGAQDFGGKDGFNHAIAVHVVDPTHVFLFDPNRGEIKLGSVAETNQFIAYLCTNAKQYNLASFDLEWAAVASNRITKGNFS